MGVQTGLGVLRFVGGGGRLRSGRFEGLLSGGAGGIVAITGDSAGGVESTVGFVFELRNPGKLVFADEIFGVGGGEGVLPPREAEFGGGAAAAGWVRRRENWELD